MALIASIGMSLAPASGLADGPKQCPPGLAKKGSCIPPGHRKQWGKGDRLPDDVVYVVVDYDVLRLPRPRRGEVYIETGGDIYLLAEATKRIIEAINLAERATR